MKLTDKIVLMVFCASLVIAGAIGYLFFPITGQSY